MTTEDLLKPRYKVIADYPGTEFKIGQVIEMEVYGPPYFPIINGEEVDEDYKEWRSKWIDKDNGGMAGLCEMGVRQSDKGNKMERRLRFL